MYERIVRVCPRIRGVFPGGRSLRVWRILVWVRLRVFDVDIINNHTEVIRPGSGVRVRDRSPVARGDGSREVTVVGGRPAGRIVDVRRIG